MNLMQPFVQKNAKGYQSIRATVPGIFEFYSFLEEPKAQPLNAVPDGCVDLLFGIGEKDVRCYIGGTVLKMKYWPFDENRRYFGVRFLPGQCILPKDLGIADIINTDIEIPVSAYGSDISQQLYEAGSIGEKAKVVTDLLKKADSRPAFDTGEEIESYIRRRIYETNGTLSIREISEETGYSECYTRRVFHKTHGISPKTFEKIVRFQNILSEMAKLPSTDYYALALGSGYYDQSHMVKEFKSFMGITPEYYRKYMTE